MTDPLGNDFKLINLQIARSYRILISVILLINFDSVIRFLGAQELLAYMKKEYCHENLRFWLAVQDLRYGPGTDVKIRKKVKEIWE